MADDEAIALYGMVKKMAQAMTAREAALDAKTAALSDAIAELKQLPMTLGKQTSQHIAAGVRASIQDDFSRPIEAAVKGPISELNQATYYARDVMRQVSKEVRFQSWAWFAVILLLGFAFGGAAGCYFFQRDIGQIDDQIWVIQQQLMTAQPTKPATKEHHRR